MATYPFKYIVTISSEFNDNHEPERVEGVTFGQNFSEAMSNIEEYYGDELLDAQLDCLEEASVYEFEN